MVKTRSKTAYARHMPHEADHHKRSRTITARSVSVITQRHSIRLGRVKRKTTHRHRIIRNRHTRSVLHTVITRKRSVHNSNNTATRIRLTKGNITRSLRGITLLKTHDDWGTRIAVKGARSEGLTVIRSTNDTRRHAITTRHGSRVKTIGVEHTLGLQSLINDPYSLVTLTHRPGLGRRTTLSHLLLMMVKGRGSLRDITTFSLGASA